MNGRILLIFVLSAIAARAQSAPAANDESQTSQSQMMTPPPVSGMSYPMAVGRETRSNFLRGGITSSASYVNNFYAGSGSSIAETTVSVLPTITYDTTSTRQHTLITYSPGFTFYQPSSELNEVDNAATVEYNLHPTPHSALNATDRFQDSSSPFNPEDAGAGLVSGSPATSAPGAIPPFAKRLTNSANAEITVQAALNRMFGFSGSESELHYPDPTQTQGLYDSSSRGGTVFYNQRVSRFGYVGATYDYQDMIASPTGGSSTTQTHTISGYFTYHPSTYFSMSISGGPQYYEAIETPLPAMGSWGMSVADSIGWQGPRVTYAASYTQGVTGGGGLLGAYHSRSANGSARWQVARTWSASVSGAYSINQTVSAVLSSGNPGGHSVSGSASLEHRIGKQIGIAFNYIHSHQSYSEVAAIAANPNSDRESISLTWNFERGLGK